eukprot:Amastigsp_a849353_34.p3 type:complete len:234 gc:universal Amastigsp_a849353_34:617-1318(+)
MTGLPATLHFQIIAFCSLHTCSMGISTPRSPRATMIPSETSRISSKFVMPWRDSIFEMILMPASRTPGTERTASTFAALRMNDAAIMSTSIRTPNSMSALSFSVTAGRSTSFPGRLTPLLSPSSPELPISQRTASPAISRTMSEMRPSSTRMTSPGTTVALSRGYVMPTRVASPTTLALVSSTNSLPRSRSTRPPATLHVRISAPLVSSMIATCLLRSFAASRTAVMVSVNHS